MKRAVSRWMVGLTALTLLGFAGCRSDAPVADEDGMKEIIPGDTDAPSVVVRERSHGKRAARFTVDAQAIRLGHFVRFEAFGEGEDGRWPRWSCVAYKNVAECFGPDGVRLPYRDADRRLVLEIDGGPLADLGRGSRLDPDGPMASTP